MQNRILVHLGRCCPCQQAREQSERMAEAAREIEAVTGDLIECCVPSPQSIIDGGRRGVKIFIAWESDELLPDNLAADVAAEIRGLVDSLSMAADALEGSAR